LRTRPDAGHHILEQGAGLILVAQARICRRDAVERHELLDRIGLAVEHHDFLQVRAGHSCAFLSSTQTESKFVATEQKTDPGLIFLGIHKAQNQSGIGFLD
jgi:hypothetical protein